MLRVKVLLPDLQKRQPELLLEATERAWIDESVRRLDAYHSGDMKAYSADEVIKELEESSKRDNQSWR